MERDGSPANLDRLSFHGCAQAFNATPIEFRKFIQGKYTTMGHGTFSGNGAFFIPCAKESSGRGLGVWSPKRRDFGEGHGFTS
jgi:hypothetical protein